MFSITPPGVIGGRCPGGLDLVVEGFAVSDFGLAGSLMVDGVGQGFVFVEDGDFSLGVLADSDFCIAQGVVWAAGLDLVDDVLELHGQVLGEGASFLVGQDDIQVIGFEQRPVSIMVAARCHRKTPVEIFPKFGQISITGFHVGDAAQAQFFHQAILQGLVGPLNASLGLRAVGTDNLDVQLLHRTSKLGQTATQA